MSTQNLHNASDAENSEFTPLLTLLEHFLSDGKKVTEYELMRWLQAPDQAIFRRDALSDPLMLFRSHFILMHCLYRLRDQWQRDGIAGLEISALAIYRTPFAADTESTRLTQYDGVAEYYLDLRQLDTSRADVEAMLRSFWEKMLLPDNQQQDLQLLELSEPVSAQQIRTQYRRLVMKHHPDRGGDQTHFCRIQAAFQRLKTRYSC